jgi:hypothetical protein
MRHDLLDPYIDVVFKLLLLDNRRLLRDMLESVLELPNSIQDQLVLNPDVPKTFSPFYDFALDVWVRLHDDRKLVLRVQATTPRKASRNYLCNRARDFIASAGSVCARTLFEPRISILWSRGSLSRSMRFHSVFQLRESHSRELFGPELEFHVFNLARAASAREESNAQVLRWARFLNARSLAELEVLAQENGAMADAKAALVKLSNDPEARRLAQARGAN